MIRARNLTRRFLFFTHNHIPLPKWDPIASRASASTRFGLSFSFSSGSEPSKGAKFPDTHVGNDDNGGVSNRELKRQIERYYEGDVDAIPEIFEIILKRKLAGIHEDDELMEELRQKAPTDRVENEESDSDLDELHDTDEKN